MPTEVKFKEDAIQACASIMVKWTEEVDIDKLKLIVSSSKVILNELEKENKQDDLIFKLITFMVGILEDKSNNDPIDNILALTILRYHYEKMGE